MSGVFANRGIRKAFASLGDAFVCPEQTGRVDACGKCGACWAGKRNVAFVAH